MIAAREWSPAEHETQVWGRIEIEEVILFFHLVQFPINATNKGFFFATDLYPSQISDTSPYHSLTPNIDLEVISVFRLSFSGLCS